MSADALVAEYVWYLTGQTLVTEPSRDIPLHTFPFSIGRRFDLACPLPSPAVSSHHAEIIQDGEDLIVQDLNSTNGTFVNGKRVVGESPLRVGDLLQLADTVFRVQKKSMDVGIQTVQAEQFSSALALVQFDRLMSQRAVTPYFQPIHRAQDKALIGYEVLGRSRLCGLQDPKSMFEAAARMNLESELSRMLRWEGIRAGQALPEEPQLFLNTHPAEIRDADVLILSLNEVREMHPRTAIALEIHEAMVTNTHTMSRLLSALKDLNIEVAYDDFGAGQSRLLELVKVPPQYLKFDIQLIRDIHLAPAQHQHMIDRLVNMVNEMGIQTIAEGVEQGEEADVCSQLGFSCLQGYYCGRPAPASQWNQ